MGDDAEKLAHFIGNKAYMRMSPAGHCAALRVERETGRFFCTAYEKRPETCRALGRGSPECLGELAEKSDRPAAARGCGGGPGAAGPDPTPDSGVARLAQE